MNARLSRRDLLRGAAATLGTSGLSLAIPASPLRGARARRPNILLILADDLGCGDLGCYGQDRIRTPYLDQVAAEGIRFTQAYAGSPADAPSRSALMTGRHTGHAFIRGDAPLALRPQDLTVAEVLKRQGYATGAFGRWSLGGPGTTGVPNRQGFGEWFGDLGESRTLSHYPDHLWRNEEKCPLPGNEGGKKEQYAHDLFTGEALDFIRRHRGHPFFLYLAGTLPRATGNGLEVPGDAPYTDQPWPQPERNKAAMITRLDADVGRILALLKELGIDEDTLLIFTSDNGPHAEGGSDPAFFRSSGPLRGIKGDLYEGGIRVPLLLRWPGTVRPRRVSDRPSALWDFLATAAEIAGARQPEATDGISLLPTLLSRPQPAHPYLYWESHERGFQQAVRLGDWKAVRRGADAPVELYDLSHDLGERENVAAKHPDVVKRIEAILSACRTESPTPPGGGGR
ncbi:MAG: arylsulfatase [Armatimonadetes bacterium]|nr:arylsulfatase [Armatimonadota bacterium]